MDTMQRDLLKPERANEDRVLVLITEALKRVHSRSRYYERLTAYIPLGEDRQWIQKIRLDEIKCAKILAEVCNQFTGQKLSADTEKSSFSGNLMMEFRKLIYKKLDDVILYKNIYIAFTDMKIRDMLFEIILDCQNHTQMLNYLHSKYTAAR